MKRELFENVKVIPGGTGVVINRTGFLSAVLAISAATAGNAKIKIEHADANDGEFVELNDPFAGVTGPVKDVAVEAGMTANVCIDLAGCKNYIKISTEGLTAECAVVLGDPASAPV